MRKSERRRFIEAQERSYRASKKMQKQKERSGRPIFDPRNPKALEPLAEARAKPMP